MTGASRPDAGVVVAGVSKKFRLYHERSFSLKEAVIHRRRVRFDELWALRDVSLEVPRGSTLGLIGLNGSGKSTLLRVIAGIHKPTEGSVVAAGRVAALLELGAGFHPELTGRENVYLNGAVLGLSRKQVRTVFDQIVEFSGVERFIDSPVKVYSSGMYARLGFAVAAHLEPDVLLIDEVLSVGDEDFRRKSLDHVNKLRHQGTTVILVSHSLASIRNLCDSVMWLHEGRMVKAGEPGMVVDDYVAAVNVVEQERLDASADASPREKGAQEGAIQDIGIEFTNRAGSPITALRTGDPVVIRVSFTASEPIDDPVVTFDFFTENHVHVAGFNSKSAALTLGRVAGAGSLVYVVDSFPLAPGSYTAIARVSDSSFFHSAETESGEFILKVQPHQGLSFSGLVHLGGTWGQRIDPRGGDG